MSDQSVTFDSRLVSAAENRSLWNLPQWYPSAFKFLLYTVFALIALGGSVRIMKAGLACPDWPLCFGDFIPDYHPQVYFEFIHRVLAGIVGLATLTLQGLLLGRSSAPRTIKGVALVSLVVLIAQIILGGATVLYLLHAKVVAAHLGMGTGFFALLLWQYLEMKKVGGANEQPAGRGAASPLVKSWILPLTVTLLVAVYGQLLLGGLVASHFASLVCTDFPTCHGQWFPTFRGIIGLHVIHRLGAYTLFAFSLISWLMLRKHAASAELKRFSGILFGLVCLQVGIGIANVLFYTPPLIAVAHLATATAILAMAVRQVHFAYSSARR